MAWWLKLVAILFKEYAHPFLKFDELNIAYISAWNFFNDWWKENFDGLEFPIGVLVLQLPWYVLLWFLFDGELYSQDMFAESSH